MNPRLFQQIASKLNRDSRRHNGVTAEQVANVASGTERTVSHPVIAEVMRELLRKGFTLTGERYIDMTPPKRIAHMQGTAFPSHVIWEE